MQAQDAWEAEPTSPVLRRPTRLMATGPRVSVSASTKQEGRGESPAHLLGLQSRLWSRESSQGCWTSPHVGRQLSSLIRRENRLELRLLLERPRFRSSGFDEDNSPETQCPHRGTSSHWV